jgi:hypothetical protein
MSEPKSITKEIPIADAILDTLGAKIDKMNLTPAVLEMMKKLPRVNPVHLKNIDTFFEKIIADKKLDASDIMQVFGLMQELFNIYDELRVKATTTEVGETLKVMFHILILYKLKDSDVLTAEEKDGILNLLDVMIKMCSEMIEYKTTIKKAKSWFCFMGGKQAVSVQPAVTAPPVVPK